MPYLLQARQTLISNLSLKDKHFSCHHPGGPPLDSQLTNLSCTGSPKLDSIFQVWSNKPHIFQSTVCTAPGTYTVICTAQPPVHVFLPVRVTGSNSSLCHTVTPDCEIPLCLTGQICFLKIIPSVNIVISVSAHFFRLFPNILM